MKGTDGYFQTTEDGRQVHSPTPAGPPARGGRGHLPPFLPTALILMVIIAVGVYFSLSAVGPDQAPAKDLGAQLPSPTHVNPTVVEEGVPGLTPKALKGLAEAAAMVLQQGDTGMLPGMFQQASQLGGCEVAGFPGWAETGDLVDPKVRREARTAIKRADNQNFQVEVDVAFGSHKGTWVIIVQSCF